ncbi:NADP-dependent oxidoreductase [Streptomyces decoyicus]
MSATREVGRHCRSERQGSLSVMRSVMWFGSLFVTCASMAAVNWALVRLGLHAPYGGAAIEARIPIYETMKAVVARNYGSPAVLAVEDLPIPRPGPGQIQVRVEAAALNGCDLDLLSDQMAGVAPLEFPHVPGSDFAGTVTEVGEGVTRFAVGDDVFGTGFPRATGRFSAAFCSPLSLTTGALAEYAVLDADTPALTHRPPTLDAERAAALPISGLTAMPLLRAGQIQPGETVLVVGATGGVGSVLVPLLAAAKANVIAAAGAADEHHVRRLGANEVIDYLTADVVA